MARWSGPGLVAAAAALLLAACGGGASGNTGTSGGGYGGSTSTPAPTSTSAPAGASGGSIKTATVTVKGKSETVLVNGSGMTLYYYTPDKDASVTCTGSCAAAWPPVAAGSSTPGPVPGATGTFGSDPNPSGGSVVTYNGWPLYTYVDDSGPGQATGEGVGGIWFVATPTLAASPSGQ